MTVYIIPADERTSGGRNQAYKHIRATTTLGQNSFWHRIISDWNSLPAAAIEKLLQRSRVSWSTRSASLSPPPPPPAWYTTMEGCWSNLKANLITQSWTPKIISLCKKRCKAIFSHSLTKKHKSSLFLSKTELNVQKLIVIMDFAHNYAMSRMS